MILLFFALVIPAIVLAFALGYAFCMRRFRAQDARFAAQDERLQRVEGLTGAILVNARKRVLAKGATLRSG